MKGIPADCPCQPARRRGRRAAARIAVAALILAAGALPAAAQEMIMTGPQPFDRARVSGFWWRGETNGTVTLPALEEAPGFEDGADVTEDLGITGGANGLLGAADIGLARRHRVLFAIAGLSQSGVREFGDALVGDYLVDSEVSLLDVRAAYSFLFLARGWLDLGAVGGIGYFGSQVDVRLDGSPDRDAPAPLPTIGRISRDYDSAYPLVGASAYIDAEDVVGIYTELTGFPSVSAAGQDGWVMNFSIDFIVSPTPEVSIIAGYKRYRLSLEDGPGAGIDLIWDGFLVGGQYVF